MHHARADGREDVARAHGCHRRHAHGYVQEPLCGQRESAGGRHRALHAGASEQRVCAHPRHDHRVRRRLAHGACRHRHDPLGRALLSGHDARLQAQDGALHQKRAGHELHARGVCQRHPGDQGVRAHGVLLRVVLRCRGGIPRLHACVVPAELGVDGGGALGRALHVARFAAAWRVAALRRADYASRLHGVHCHSSGLHRRRFEVRPGGRPDLAYGCLPERGLGFPRWARACASHATRGATGRVVRVRGSVVFLP